jgi:hypothetical protein
VGFFNNKTHNLSSKKLLDEKQITNSILADIHDHFDGISIRHTSNESMLKADTIEYKSLGVNFVNRYLNTAVYDSLVQSGAFLLLRPRLQTRLANIYGDIKDHNEKLKEFNSYWKGYHKKIDFKSDLVQIQTDDPKLFLEMKDLTELQKSVRVRLLILENRLNRTTTPTEEEDESDHVDDPYVGAAIAANSIDDVKVNSTAESGVSSSSVVGDNNSSSTLTTNKQKLSHG